ARPARHRWRSQPEHLEGAGTGGHRPHRRGRRRAAAGARQLGRAIMSAVVRMPQLAAGGTDAAIQTWLVAVGDTVDEGQAIVEIETEKAVVEHETEVAGVIAGLLVSAGDSTAVGTPIAVIAEPGETAEQALAAADAESGASVPAAAA